CVAFCLLWSGARMVGHGGTRLLTGPRRLVAVVVSTALVAGLWSGTPAAAKPKGEGAAKPPATSPGPSVKGVKPMPTRFVTPRDDAKSTHRPARTVWPAAASAQVELGTPQALSAGSPKARAAGTPVWAQPVAVKSGQSSGPKRLAVTVAGRKAAEAAGVDGVLLSVTPDRSSGAARVGVDYAGFAEAFGGNYGSRLRLVRLPECALTTPKAAACRTAQPLASTNDPAARTVSAEVPMTASASGARVVLAAVAAAGEEGGNGGTYAATD
ncbi:sugar-binding protein, partial [Micromonospora sp. DH15]|nr:sugar-binding protein [Micromonospora sp. DH15]